MSWSTHTDKCPHCLIEITLPVEQWNTEEKCSLCKEIVQIDYDEYWEEGMEEESVTYTFYKS